MGVIKFTSWNDDLKILSARKSMDNKPKPKIDRRLFTILLIVFVQMLGAAMILPILPLFAQSEFRLTPSTITLLFSSFFVAQFIAGPYLGRLSDKIGRLPVLIVSQIGTAISFAMIGFAPSAVFLFAARIFDGITGGNIIVAQAYVTDVTPPVKRTQSLGYVFGVFGLGFIIGPAFGGFLAAEFGPRIPFYFAAVVAVLTVILTWVILDESLTEEQKEKNRTFKKASLRAADVVKNGPLLLILIVVFVAQFALGLLQSTFALFGEAVLFADYPREAMLRGVGLLLTVVGITQFSTQTFLLRPLLKRFGEAQLIVYGNLLRAFGTFFYAIAATPVIGAIGSILFPFGLGIMLPPLQGMATRTVPDELRGGVLGWYQSSISLSIILGTALGGVLFEINPSMPYWVGTGSGLLALIPAVLLLQQSRAGKIPGYAPAPSH